VGSETQRYKADDAALVRRWQDGDRDGFEQLFVRHHGSIYNLAYRLLGRAADAEDVAVDAFVRADAGIRRLRDPATFPTWIRRIATNLCRDLARRGQKIRFHSLDTAVEPGADAPVGELPDSGPGPPDRVQERIVEDRVRNALAEVPIERREVLVLYHFDGCDVAEISEILGIPPGTVKSRLARGRDDLRPYLADLAPGAENEDS
jgi:RNA polymerase sigma-70 factor (ECF subfamily)